MPVRKVGLQQRTVKELRNFVGNYKKKNCPSAGTRNKAQLIQLVQKLKAKKGGGGGGGTFKLAVPVKTFTPTNNAGLSKQLSTVRARGDFAFAKQWPQSSLPRPTNSRSKTSKRVKHSARAFPRARPAKKPQRVSLEASWPQPALPRPVRKRSKRATAYKAEKARSDLIGSHGFY